MPSHLALGAWRLLIAACGFFGFGMAMATLHDPWPALSQQASLVAGVVYVGLAWHGAGRLATWLRGATTVLLLLVCVTYLTVIDGDLDTASSLFEHLVTPLLALADWVFVTRGRTMRWWYPLTWVAFPLAYLVYFVVADVQLYHSFLNPSASDFAPTVLAFLIAVVGCGYVLYVLARMTPTRAEVAT